MFYQVALLKLCFYPVSIACLQSEIDIKVAMFEKADSANSLPFAVYFHMGAYKHDVVLVIKMSAYIHGVLILCGSLLSRFYGSLI